MNFEAIAFTDIHLKSENLSGEFSLNGDIKDVYILGLIGSFILILASTGQGKTSGFIVPNILRFSGGSFVCTDPSGEILSKTRSYITHKLGMKIKVFDLENIDNSLHFNCLERVESGFDAQKLATILIEAGGQKSTKGSDSFWSDSARSAIQMIILALTNPNQFEYEKNLTSLFIILNKGFEDDEVARFMVHNLDDTVRLQFMAFMKQESKVRASIMSTAKTAISLMASEELQQVTEQDSLRFEELRTEDVALFIICREDEWKHLSFLTSILIEQLLKFCMGPKIQNQKYNPIYFFLEEAGHLMIPSLPTMTTTLRRRKCSLNLVLQDYKQLSHYGADAEVIINNCLSRLYFPGLPIDVCEKVERMMGKETVQVGKSLIGKPLMSADEIRTMKDIICIHGSRKPMKLKVLPFFKQRELRKRINYKPKVK